MLFEQAKSWQAKRLFVGCSGKFTIERSLAPLGLEYHSNDVQVYTCALGMYAATGDVDVRLSEYGRETIPWIEETLTDGARKAAAVQLTSNFAASDPNILYFQRQARGYQQQWPRLLEQTAAKVVAFRESTKIKTFTPGDVIRWLTENAGPDDAVCLSIPFIEGGYTTMFEGLAKIWDWDEPSFDELTPERIDQLIDVVRDRRDWAFVWCNRVPELEPHLQGVMLRTGLRSGGQPSAPHYVYGSTHATRFQTPAQKVAPVKIPRLGPGDRLPPPDDAQLRLTVLSAPQFNGLRAVYMGRHIRPAQVNRAYGVTVNGVLVGVVGLGQSTNDGGSGPMNIGRSSVAYPAAFLMTDFAVSPTDYPRLSKLVVLALVTREAQQHYQHALNCRIRSVVTTAFTNRPVSMKYRGILNLIDRKDREPDDATKYALNYGALIGGRTLDDAYRLWWEKWGQTKDDHAEA
jgi:hypothetical protein